MDGIVRVAPRKRVFSGLQLCVSPAFASVGGRAEPKQSQNS